jgi:hypothetical protein
MYDVRIDTSKNRMYITLAGFMSAEEVRTAADAVIEAGKKMHTNFDVVNNIADFKPGSPEVGTEIKRAQTFLKENGVRHVIRITGESTIAAMQMQRLGKEAGYKADSAGTVAEADKLIDMMNHMASGM